MSMLKAALEAAITSTFITGALAAPWLRKWPRPRQRSNR